MYLSDLGFKLRFGQRSSTSMFVSESAKALSCTSKVPYSLPASVDARRLAIEILNFAFA